MKSTNHTKNNYKSKQLLMLLGVKFETRDEYVKHIEICGMTNYYSHIIFKLLMQDMIHTIIMEEQKKYMNVKIVLIVHINKIAVQKPKIIEQYNK